MPRLDQLLASLGYGSRREVKDWIAYGRVTVQGSTADDPGMKVAAQQVAVDGDPLDHPEGLLVLLHKPLGLVCSHDAREGPSVYDLMPPRWRRRNPPLTSIGRLDKETSGLLLLTDQSALVHELTSPKQKVVKYYSAMLDRNATTSEGAELVERFAAGTLLLEGETTPCAPAKLLWTAPNEAELHLTEGRYHQVRRMFAAVGFTVVRLHRTRFGQLALDDLEAGQWRTIALETPIR